MQKLSATEKNRLNETLKFTDTGLLEIDKEFLSCNGYAVFDLLNENDLLVTKQLIYETVSENLLQLGITNPFTSYNDMHADWSDLFHAQTIRKKNRLFSSKNSHMFLSIQGIKNLLSAFPEFHLGEVTYGRLEVEAREEIYFRIVRPQAVNDVGPLHADCWYHEIYKNSCDIGGTLKVWISISTEEGLNGLEFAEGSHQYRNSYSVKHSEDGPRPVPSQETNNLSTVLPRIKPGQAFIFPDTAIHRGALNKGNYPRVSIELSLYRAQYPK
jgi:hypothetical protein